jgi:hypothetical protein
MATMTMATVESGLQARIREAQLKVREREQELEATVHELSGAEDLLSSLQTERMTECINMAKGVARADPSRFDRQILGTKDRISGLEALKRRREISLVDCRVLLFDLQAEAGKIELEKQIRAEGEETRAIISKVEDAIVARNRFEKEIAAGIHALRGKKYLGEMNRRLGTDSAFRLDRLNAGMRP